MIIGEIISKEPTQVLLVEDDFGVIEEVRKAFAVGLREITIDVATTASEAIMVPDGRANKRFSPSSITRISSIRG